MHSIANPYRENASSGFRATNSSSICPRLFFCSLMSRLVLYRCPEKNHVKPNPPKPNSAKALAGKPVSDSRSEMAEVVLPAQTNPLGKILGRHVMHLVDIAAAMAAH